MIEAAWSKWNRKNRRWVGKWVGGGGTGINGTKKTRRGNGAGHMREERSGDCPLQHKRPGIEGQRMPAIGGNSHVSY